MFLDAEPERGFTRGRFDGGSVSVDDPDHVGDRLPRRRVRAISEDPVTEELAAEFGPLEIAAGALHLAFGTQTPLPARPSPLRTGERSKKPRRAASKSA